MNMVSTRSPLLELFDGLDDQAFIGRAYLDLLGRPVDAESLRSGLARLATGVSRERICEVLLASREGRRYAAHFGDGVPGGEHADPHVITSVADLLRVQAESFLRCSFLLLLDREPSREEMTTWGTREALGLSRVHLLLELFSLRDPKAPLPMVAGLAGLVRLKEKMPEELTASSSLPTDGV